jgi:hypothetical protein
MGQNLYVEYESGSFGITNIIICAHNVGCLPESATLLPMSANIQAASLGQPL